MLCIRSNLKTSTEDDLCWCIRSAVCRFNSGFQFGCGSDKRLVAADRHKAGGGLFACGGGDGGCSFSYGGHQSVFTYGGYGSFVTAPYYGFGSHPVGDNGGNQRFGRSRFQGQSLMIEGDALYGHRVVVIVVVATGGCQRCCHKAEEKDS